MSHDDGKRVQGKISYMRIWNSASFKENAIHVLISFSSTLVLFRSYLLSGQYFGDPGDARLAIVNIEHWYRVLFMGEPLSGGVSFWPYPYVAGLTESYFTQALIYVPVRILGFGSVSSINLTYFLIIVLGLLGFLKLGKILGLNGVYLYLLPLLIAHSYAFTTQLTHFATSAFLLVSWPLIGIIRVGRKSSNSSNKYYIFIGLPLIALGSWYAFCLFFMIMGIMALAHLYKGKSKPTKKQIVEFWNVLIGKTEKRKKFAILATSVSLLSLWGTIYLPNLNLLSKNWGEQVFYAPRLGDLVNSSVGANGIYAKLFEAMKLNSGPTFERALGLTPGFVLILICVLLINRQKGKSDHEFSNSFYILNQILISITILIALLLTDDAGHSFWFPIWEVIPGVSSLRNLYRVMIFVYIVLIVYFLLILQKKKSTLLVTLVLSSLVLFDNYRIPYTNWNDTNMKTTQIQEFKQNLKGKACEVFYIRPDTTNTTPWITQVDAMLAATQSGVPTVNGYASKVPSAWPQTGAWGSASDEQVLNWLQSQGIKGTSVCIFDERFTYLKSIKP